jgi:5'-3' exonuclease
MNNDSNNNNNNNDNNDNNEISLQNLNLDNEISLQNLNLDNNNNNSYELIEEYSNNKIIIDEETPLLFIDLSYYIFYRFYALVSWYKKAYPDEELDISDIMNNKIFIEKFKKLFKENLKKIKKKYKIENSKVIFAKDCRRNQIWRNEFYEEYKKTRDDKNINFNKDIFLYVYNDILPELLNDNTGIHSIYSVSKAEADDIIAVMKNVIREKYSNLPIYIITNDHDYLQLADYYTYIYNLKNYDLKKKGKGSPELDLGFKIIKGDISDNIKAVFTKRITNKLIYEMIYDEQKLNNQINSEGAECRKRYERNRLLIDFKKIPQNIQNIIKSFLIFNN